MNDTTHHFTGGYLAIVSVIGTAVVSEIVKFDTFFHGLSGVLTSIAAGLSIYYTLKKHKKD